MGTERTRGRQTSRTQPTKSSSTRAPSFTRLKILTTTSCHTMSHGPSSCPRARHGICSPAHWIESWLRLALIAERVARGSGTRGCVAHFLDAPRTFPGPRWSNNVPTGTTLQPVARERPGGRKVPSLGNTLHCTTPAFSQLARGCPVRRSSGGPLTGIFSTSRPLDKNSLSRGTQPKWGWAGSLGARPSSAGFTSSTTIVEGS